MRPLRLTIEGLTAFRKEQVIDFTDLDLFVVTGPTGAGKSTILDAMVLALYGAIPRMTTGPSALVTHGETMARVQLEFSADGETYRVSRRLPKRGAQSAMLERRDGDDWVPAVEEGGVRPVNARLEEIVGLDFDGFTRAVLLPQGEFAGIPSRQEGAAPRDPRPAARSRALRARRPACARRGKSDRDRDGRHRRG